MTYTVEIPRLPSPELNPNSRTHWSKRAKAMDTDKQDIVAYFLHKYGRPETPLEKAKLHIKYVLKRTRKMDMDNALARAKGFIDGLVAVGAIQDDSTDVLTEITFKVTVSKDYGPLTVLDVAEVN